MALWQPHKMAQRIAEFAADRLFAAFKSRCRSMPPGPAARKGDPVTHDMIVPAGAIGPPITGPCNMSPVIIESLPAAHVMCNVICSGATLGGPVHPPMGTPPPTPPDPIVTGSLTVFIHNMPAARWAPSGDVTTCGAFLGMPTLAAQRTVIIGD